jgi:hypothetical protein
LCAHPPSSCRRHRRPPAALLHRHAIESIFAFLDLRDLAAALRVSRDWLVAVGSMRRLELSVWPRETTPLNTVVESAVSRHAGRLFWYSNEHALGAAALSLLAGRMAHLRRLQCRLRQLPSFVLRVPLAFPASLRSLAVDFADPVDAIQINAVVAAVGRLPLLEDFTIDLMTILPQISFPLRRWPRRRCYRDSQSAYHTVETNSATRKWTSCARCRGCRRSTCP